MDISGLYNSYVADAATQATTNTLKNSLENTDYENASDDQLLNACKEFETYFLEQVMKKMMDTVSTEEDSVMNNKLVSYFMDSTVTELCKEATDQKSLGLAQMLYEQMKRNCGTPIVSEESQSEMEENSDLGAELIVE